MKTQAFSTGYPVSGFVSGQKLSGNIRLSGIRQIAIRCTPTQIWLKMIGKVSSNRFRRVTCLLIPKFWSGVSITLNKCQKCGSGMLRTCIRSPVKTKVMVIKTSNTA